MPLAKDSKPFIHGSSSSVLALLPHTEFMLYSSVWMIDKYRIAPIGGEIVQGGLDTILSESRLAFGVASPAYHYNLQHILSKYAIPAPLQQKEELVALARKNIEEAPHSLFCKINQLLIYLTRLKQMNVPNSAWISEEEIASLHQQANATLQFFYLLLLLGKNINPNDEKVGIIRSQGGRSIADLRDAITTHLSADKIVEEIIKNKLNIESIYNHPTHEMLQRVSDLLKLPNNLTVRDMYDHKRDVTLSETSVFSPSAPLYDPAAATDDIDDIADANSLAHSICANIRNNTISNLLRTLVSRKKPSKEFFDTFHSVVLRYREALINRLQTLDFILSKKPSDLRETPHRKFIEKPFPIVLITERWEKLDAVGMEFRANTPLKLGDDILVIATDSLENQKLVQEYLHANQLDAVSVITFEELEKATTPKPISEALAGDNSEEKTSPQPSQALAVDQSEGVFAAIAHGSFFGRRVNDVRVSSNQENGAFMATLI